MNKFVIKKHCRPQNLISLQKKKKKRKRKIGAARPATDVPSIFLVQRYSAHVKKMKQFWGHYDLLLLHSLEWSLEALYKAKHKDDQVI